MVTMGAARASRLPSLLVFVLLSLNAAPFVMSIPAVAQAASNSVHPYHLLPLVVLPTVVVAIYESTALRWVQFALAALAAIAAAILGPLPAASTVVVALSALGTVAFLVLVIERSRRALIAHRDGLVVAGRTDSLTGALNRRGIDEHLPTLVSAALGSRREIGIAVIDLDHFKAVNDVFGHAVGDRVLQLVCDEARHLIGAHSGPGGVVARSGGEEIILLTNGAAQPVVAALVARLAERVAADALPPVTASVGVIRADPTALSDPEALWSAVAVADFALYRAKSMGRDRVIEGSDFFRTAKQALPRQATYGGGFARGLARVAAGIPQGALEDVDESPLPGAPPSDAAEVRAGTDGSAATAGGAVGRGVPARAGSAGLAARLRASWIADVTRARGQAVAPEVHRLYRMIVAWTMLVGIVTTGAEAWIGTATVARAVAMLVIGWVLGAAIIVWMGRLRTSWALLPLFAVGAVFEAVVVFAVGPDSRPGALMLFMLVGLLLVHHLPTWGLGLQVLLTFVASVGAAQVGGRSLAVTLAVAAVTALALIISFAVAAMQRQWELRAEEQLHLAACTDPLTGVGNRRALGDIALAWECGSLAMVDIDGFKALNDERGHAHGDEILKTVAAALESVAVSLGGECRVCRIGGDEFVLARRIPAGGTGGPGGPRGSVGTGGTGGPGGTGATGDDARANLAQLIEGAVTEADDQVSVSVGVAAWRDGDPAPAGSADVDRAQATALLPGARRDPDLAADLWSALARADAHMLGRKRARATPQR